MRRVDVARLRFEEPKRLKEETVLIKREPVHTVFVIDDGYLPPVPSSPRDKEEAATEICFGCRQWQAQKNKKGQAFAGLQEVRADDEKLLEQLVVLTEKEKELSAKTEGVEWVQRDDKKNVHDQLQQERRTRGPKKGGKPLTSDSSAGGRVRQEL